MGLATDQPHAVQSFGRPFDTFDNADHLIKIDAINVYIDPRPFAH